MKNVITKFNKFNESLEDKQNYDYTDIKSFEDACRVLNVTPHVPNTGDEDSKSVAAYYKICIIISAINGEWKADFSDSNQIKFFNVYIYSGSGLRFSRTNTNCGYARTSIGGRLCFESREKAEYFSNNFIDLINAYLN
jgi:hypothetical protein